MHGSAVTCVTESCDLHRKGGLDTSICHELHVPKTTRNPSR
jgi:hypothetical protein